MEGGEGLSSAGGHDQQDAVLPFGDRFDRGVDGVALVVVGLRSSLANPIVLQDDLFDVGGEPFPGDVAGPQVAGGREGVEVQMGFDGGGLAGAVVEEEAVAVGRKDEGDVERGGVIEGLLHPGADAVLVVFGFDQCDREVGFVEEDVIGTLGLAAGHDPAADGDPTFGEGMLFADLQHFVPTRAAERRCDELGANVAFG